MTVPEHTDLMIKLHKEGNLRVALNDDKELVHTPMRALDAQEEAVQRAWEAVQTVAARKPHTLYKCWDECLVFRGVDVTSREGKRSNGRWKKFAQHMPDVVISEDTPMALEQALDTFQEAKKQKGNAISSIQRDTNEFIACFRWTSREYRLNWRPIESKLTASKKTKKETKKQKLTLTRNEQSLLLTNALAADTPMAAALLVLFQGGGMATEIARLRVEEDLWLNHESPFIAFLGGWNRETKNEDRPRFIPIVFELDLIRDKLPEAIEVLAKRSEPSSTLTRELQKMLLPVSRQRHFTSHCLRHTFRLNAQNVLANYMATMAIAGWSNEKTNKIAAQYGAEGFSHSESLKALHIEQRRIFAHLIKQEQEYMVVNSNVLPFSGDKS